jgi:hypothetical protein
MSKEQKAFEELPDQLRKVSLSSLNYTVELTSNFPEDTIEKMSKKAVDLLQDMKELEENHELID